MRLVGLLAVLLLALLAGERRILLLLELLKCHRRHKGGGRIRSPVCASHSIGLVDRVHLGSAIGLTRLQVRLLSVWLGLRARILCVLFKLLLLLAVRSGSQRLSHQRTHQAAAYSLRQSP